MPNLQFFSFSGNRKIVPYEFIHSRRFIFLQKPFHGGDEVGTHDDPHPVDRRSLLKATAVWT